MKPCWHMRAALSQLSDGSLHGFSLWFVLQHLGGCSRCRQALDTLKNLRERLARLHGGQERLSEPRRDALERALDAIESKK